MEENLCRGWTSADVAKAVRQATPLARQILRAIAQNPGVSAEEIAAEIGASGMTAVAGSLSSWYQNVTRPLGIRDPATGKYSWPFDIDNPYPGTPGRNYRYVMPPSVAEIVLAETAGDG
jgi:hypothetical protein